MLFLLFTLSYMNYSDYFPLQVGNKWIYQSYIPVLEPNFSFDSMMVVDKQKYGKDEYYKVVFHGETYWFSYHNNELRVYTVSDSSSKSVSFDTTDYDVWLELPVKLGSHFSYKKKNRYKIVSIVSKEKILYTPGGRFKNCIKVSNIMGDMWFAKGIGLIKMRLSPVGMEIVSWKVSD